MAGPPNHTNTGASNTAELFRINVDLTNITFKETTCEISPRNGGIVKLSTIDISDLNSVAYNVPANEDCGYICPVCFWENDPFIASDNEPSDSNHGITLKEAKSNFSKFGACEKEMLCYVRPPRDDEKEIS